MRQLTPVAPPRTAVRPGHTYIPMMVFLAFGAFLLTGFGSGLGAFQPIPVYLFLCLALITLQEHIAENRSIAHRAFVFLASSFAVLYAGEVVFDVHGLRFTRNPATYVMLNIVLLLIFATDTALRRRTRPRATTLAGRYGTWALDAAAIAVFFYVTAFLLDLLGGQSVLRYFGVHVGEPYIIVDLNKMFHLTWHSPVNTLDGLNLILGVSATALALLLLVVAGVVLEAPDGETNQSRALHSFAGLLRDAGVRLVQSLRLVSAPLIWLIPAFSLAVFADHVAQYFNESAHTPSSLIDLFNPFSSASRANFALGVSTLLLGLIAVMAMVAAVAVLEQSAYLIWHTLQTFWQAGRAVALTWAIFMYSLAAVNAVAVLLNVTQAKPFQVGAPGILALLIGIMVLVLEMAAPPPFRPPRATRTPLPANAYPYTDPRGAQS